MKFDEYFKLKSLTINVTEECNMIPNCIYCYEHNKSKNKMSNEMMKEILDKCYHNYIINEPNDKFLVNFFGGEPCTNFDVIEYAVKYAKEKDYNMDFGITTNLLVLTDHMMDVIEEYDINLLISIDGTKETHNRNRSNSFDIVESNVQKLIKRGLKHLLEARMTVMPKETHLLLDGIKTIFNMGIDNIAPVAVTDTKWEEEDFKNYEENLIKVWDWVFSVYNDENNKRNLSVKLIEDYIEKIFDNSMTLDFMKETCHAGGPKSCSIGVNGEIMPCHQRHTMGDKEKLTYGNILEDDVKEVPFNDGTIKGAFECNECPAYSICKGGCPSENYTQNGNGNVMNETQCLVFITQVVVAIQKQNELFECKKIRSHRLSIIYENLKLYRDLIETLQSNDVSKYMNLYERIVDMDDILLPQMEMMCQKLIKNRLKR